MKIEARKIGEWTGLMIPPEVARTLGASGDKPLFATIVREGELRITSFDPQFEEAMALVDNVMDEYDHALRVLAR